MSASDIAALRDELARSRWLRSETEADREEIVTDAIARVATRFAEATQDDRVRIGHAVVRYMVWARRRRKRVEATSRTDVLDAAVAAERTPDEQAAHEELRRELATAIARVLSEEERAVLVHRFIEGRTARECAERLGVSTQHIYYLTRRSFAALQEALAGFDDVWR